MNEDSKNNIPVPLSGFRHSIRFFHYVFKIIKLIRPIFLSLLMLIMLLGIIIGIREGWTIGDSLYFAFITGFTIGYGDLTPSYPLTRFLAIILSCVGFLFTGILVAIAVQALHFTIKGDQSRDTDKK